MTPKDPLASIIDNALSEIGGARPGESRGDAMWRLMRSKGILRQAVVPRRSAPLPPEMVASMTNESHLPNEAPMKKSISASADPLADTDELPQLHPAYIAHMRGLAAAPPPTKEERLTYARLAAQHAPTLKDAHDAQNILPPLTPAESMQAAIDHEAQQQAMQAYRRRVHWLIAGAMVALAVAIVIAAVRT